MRAHFCQTWTLLALCATAAAEPSRVGDSHAALPAVVSVATAEPMQVGVVGSGFAGYGYTGEVTGGGDAHHRALGELSLSVRPWSWLAAGLRFDGRYDKHTGGGVSDNGWVGDPRINLRAVTQRGQFAFGGQTVLWFPGGNAPSFVARATTVDLLGIATYLPENSPLSLSINAGFRLDNSAKSISNPMALSLADRTALEVSDSNAVLLGAGASYRHGNTEGLLEFSADLLVGSDAPPASRSPMRISAGARQHFSQTVSAQVAADFNVGKTPTVDMTSALSPVEPRFKLTFGFVIAFGASDRAPAATPIEEARGTVRGTVTWNGAPVAGARITLGDREAQSGSDGRFELQDVPLGRGRLQVSAPGYGDQTRIVVVDEGSPAEIELPIEKQLPPGMLRGVVRSISGAPLPASLLVEPGAIAIKANSDGTFQLELKPGTYKVTVSAPGHLGQTVKAVVTDHGVTIYNFDLRRQK